MTIQQLRCFVTAAKLLSIRRAADELYISQPAVTRHIQELETELKVPLFHRTGRRITLTEPGRIFYMDAVDILDRLTLAVQRVQRSSVNGDVIHVACESTLQMPQLPEIFRMYHERLPQVYISNTEVGSQNKLGLFSSNQTDACFVIGTGPLAIPGVSYRTLVRSRFCCVVPDGHPLAARGNVTMDDLAHESLILLDTAHCPPENTQVQQQLQFRCPEAEFCFSGSSLYTIPMIEAGLGIAVMPELVCPSSASVCSIPLLPFIPIESGLVWHTDDTSEKVAAFVETVISVFQQDNVMKSRETGTNGDCRSV